MCGLLSQPIEARTTLETGTPRIVTNQISDFGPVTLSLVDVKRELLVSAYIELV